MKKIDVNNSWEMHRVGDDDWITATVPGSVYGDLLQAGKMEDPFWKDNEIESLKLMDYDYEYRTSFSCDDELLESDEVILRFGHHCGYHAQWCEAWTRRQYAQDMGVFGKGYPKADG